LFIIIPGVSTFFLNPRLSIFFSNQLIFFSIVQTTAPNEQQTGGAAESIHEDPVEQIGGAAESVPEEPIEQTQDPVEEEEDDDDEFESMFCFVLFIIFPRV